MQGWWDCQYEVCVRWVTRVARGGGETSVFVRILAHVTLVPQGPTVNGKGGSMTARSVSMSRKETRLG